MLKKFLIEVNRLNWHMLNMCLNREWNKIASTIAKDVGKGTDQGLSIAAL